MLFNRIRYNGINWLRNQIEPYLSVPNPYFLPSSFAHSYPLVNGISLGLAQSDSMKRHLLSLLK